MSTANILFELLRNTGFIKDDEVDIDRVARATPTEIIDLSTESAELTSAEHMPRNRSAFAHSASLSLGGGGEPCMELKCRTKRVNELIQFAALYSDKIYIHNFLSNFAAHKQDAPDEAGISHMRKVLANDLQVLSQLRPLIEAGRIVPITPVRVGVHIA